MGHGWQTDRESRIQEPNHGQPQEIVHVDTHIHTYRKWRVDSRDEELRPRRQKKEGRQ